MEERSVRPAFIAVALLTGVIASVPLARPAPAFEASKPAGAAPTAPPAQTFSGDRITLLEAVRLTLLLDPNLKLSEQQMIGAKGSAQSESGTFDPLLAGNAAFSLSKTALGSSTLLPETATPDQLRQGIGDAVSRGGAATAAVTELTKLQGSPAAYRMPQSDPDLASVQAQVDTYNQLIGAASDPVARATYSRLRDELVTRSLAGAVDARNGAAASEARQRQRLTTLADVPTDQKTTKAAFDLSLRFPFRDGVTLGVVTNGGWRRDQLFGDDGSSVGGKTDAYDYSVGFTLDAALLRGRGVDATGAAERAAGINWEASALAYRHAASTSVLSTVAAYWSLVGLQEQLAIARASLALTDRSVEVTRALIAGDELPPAELSRVLASRATDASQVISLERAVEEARVNLARTIGLSVADLANAPLAADPFPPAPDATRPFTFDVPGLLGTATSHRLDRQAALKLKESGGVLLRSARTALRPKLDLHALVSAGTVAEASFSNLGSGWNVPSFAVSLAFEQPLGNNAARGLVVQQEAALEQQTISAADLERVIRANVVQIIRSLQVTAEQVARAEEATSHYRKTVEDESERFRSGQSTLIDKITTQQLGTSAFFTYAAARQQWATLLAQLRFETGTIVEEARGENVVRLETLVTPPSPTPAK